MLQNLTLHHFRNYTEQEVLFSQGLNCLVGRNGQGKTNLLEAVYFLALLRSFRTTDGNDLKQWLSPDFLLRGTVQVPDMPSLLLQVHNAQGRHLRINNTPIYRASDFINHLLCITLIPQDLNLIQGAPAERRRFLDIAISQIQPGYIHHLQTYNEALHSRNAMLRQPQKYSQNAIRAFDPTIVKEGALLEFTRRTYVRQLNTALTTISPRLLNAPRSITLHYLSKLGTLTQEENGTLPELENKFREGLDRNFERDSKEGATTLGPQRADFTSMLDNVRMSHFSSQGECRLASLALRLACLEILEKQVGLQRVTLLVDDVLGELDAPRRKFFLQELEKAGQVLLACTELPTEISPKKTFFIQAGQILPA